MHAWFSSIHFYQHFKIEAQLYHYNKRLSQNTLEKKDTTSILFYYKYHVHTFIIVGPMNMLQKSREAAAAAAAAQLE